MLGLLTSLTAASIDMSLPAIPAMVRDLATSMSLGQQIVGLFMAGIALGQLPAGLLSDRLGRMPVLYGGLLIFIASGLAASLSDDIRLMLAARFVQGLGSSVGIVMARAIARDVASGTEAARLLSVMIMIFTAAPMLAPLLGAWLVTAWGWRAPFYALVIVGLLAIGGVRLSLEETHRPVANPHILVQLWQSLKEFFSHRQSVFGSLLVLLTAFGFMSLISGSAALIIEIYGFPVRWFGLIFALTGIAILAGSYCNRRLLVRFDAMHVAGIGATILAVAAVQMLAISWLGTAPFWWLWAAACLYMFGTGFVMPNATALALDPVPRIAGVASSIIGTVQGTAAACSAIVSASLYDGTVTNITWIMGIAGSCCFAAFALRRFIAGAAVQP